MLANYCSAQLTSRRKPSSACSGHFLPKTSARPCVDLVQEQLATAGKEAAECAIVSAAGLDHLGDEVHFNAESLDEFGRRYADAWAALDLAGSWRFQVAPAPPPAGTAGRALAAVATDPVATAVWQTRARSELARLLLGEGADQPPHSGDAEILAQETTEDGTSLTKLGYTSTAGPGATAWLAVPPVATTVAPTAGVLVLPGHGGTAEEVVKGSEGACVRVTPDLTRVLSSPSCFGLPRYRCDSVV